MNEDAEYKSYIEMRNLVIAGKIPCDKYLSIKEQSENTETKDDQTFSVSALQLVTQQDEFENLLSHEIIDETYQHSREIIYRQSFTFD